MDKLHHLDEYMHHAVPESLRQFGIHHMFTPSGMVLYTLILLVVFSSLGITYLCLWIHYRRTRGININEMYLAEVIDMVFQKQPAVYQQVPGSNQAFEMTQSETHN